LRHSVSKEIRQLKIVNKNHCILPVSLKATKLMNTLYYIKQSNKLEITLELQIN